MESVKGFFKSLLGLFWNAIKLLFAFLKAFLIKTWKVILGIILFIISIFTLKAFKKKGGKVECEES